MVHVLVTAMGIAAVIGVRSFSDPTPPADGPSAPAEAPAAQMPAMEDDDDPPADVHGAGVNPHGQNPHAGAGSADPHANLADPRAASAAPVEVKRVDRAPGPSGKTVAEIIGQRSSLSGKTVRVRGTVVKMTAGVLGKTYLHLRDGSGDAAAGTNDVTITTTATPAVGDVVTLEGVVALDRDIGSGYRFPTLVEDAKVVQ